MKQTGVVHKEHDYRERRREEKEEEEEGGREGGESIRVQVSRGKIERAAV